MLMVFLQSGDVCTCVSGDLGQDGGTAVLLPSLVLLTLAAAVAWL